MDRQEERMCFLLLGDSLNTQTQNMLRCCFLTPLYGHPLQPLRVESIEVQPVDLANYFLLKKSRLFFIQSWSTEFKYSATTSGENKVCLSLVWINIHVYVDIVGIMQCVTSKVFRFL